MSYCQLEVSSRNYLQALRALEVFTLTCESHLIKDQYDVNYLMNPSTRIPFKDIDKYIQNLHEDEAYTHDYPFRAGGLMTLNRHTLLFQDGKSVTVDGIFRSFTVYFKLIMSALSYDYFTDDKMVVFLVKPIECSSVKTLNFHFSIIASALYWSLYDILGGDVPSFKISLPASLKPLEGVYAQLTKAKFQFKENKIPELRIEFPNGITYNNPEHFQTRYESQHRLSNKIDDLLIYQQGVLADWVCEMLQEPNRQLPTLTELASTLNLSIRTFERYLEKEGVGFRELCADVKNRRALALLKEGHPVSYIASRLGFSSGRSFTRSFKNYNKLSPTQYRLQRVNS